MSHPTDSVKHPSAILPAKKHHEIEIQVDDPKVGHRIEQASGYLELGMAAQALERLKGVGSKGPIEGTLQFLRGQSLHMLARHEEAFAPLHAAALLIPPPNDSHVWRTLSECYKATGHKELAAKLLARSRRAVRRVVIRRRSDGNSR